MNKKKVLIWLSCICLAVLIVSTAVAIYMSGSVKSAEALRAESIVVLHTNDVHGAVDHYAEVAALKQKYESEGNYVLLFDAGDFIQGDPVVSSDSGASAVELMNLCGYDAAAPGNHEFDYGYNNLKILEKQAAFPFLGANILYSGENAFAQHKIFTTPAGRKIGVFGLDTPDTATKSHPAKIRGVTFIGQENAQQLYECAQKQVDILKSEKCDIIICLGHLGIDGESGGYRSVDVLNNVGDIDIFIDGHSHSTLEDIRKATDGSGKTGGCYLTSTGAKLEGIGKIVIKGGEVLSVETIDTEELQILPDAAVAEALLKMHRRIDSEYGRVFAKSEITLDGEKADVRTRTTNLCSLITDAMLWKVRGSGIECDAVIVNGGGIRASVQAGDITKKDINTVLPFKNELCVIDVTGEELLEVMEASTFCSPEPTGGFPQTAGIVYTLDTSKPYDAGENYPGSTYASPNSVNRINIVSVNGAKFDKNAVYSIVTNDFLASGGDTYYVFGAAKKNINLGILVDEAVMDYIVTKLNGVITSSEYGTVRKQAYCYASGLAA